MRTRLVLTAFLMVTLLVVSGCMVVPARGRVAVGPSAGYVEPEYASPGVGFVWQTHPPIWLGLAPSRPRLASRLAVGDGSAGGQAADDPARRHSRSTWRDSPGSQSRASSLQNDASWSSTCCAPPHWRPGHPPRRPRTRSALRHRTQRQASTLRVRPCCTVAPHGQAHLTRVAEQLLLKSDDINVESPVGISSRGAGNHGTKSLRARQRLSTNSGASMRAGVSTHSLRAKYWMVLACRTYSMRRLSYPAAALGRLTTTVKRTASPLPHLGRPRHRLPGRALQHVERRRGFSLGLKICRVRRCLDADQRPQERRCGQFLFMTAHLAMLRRWSTSTSSDGSVHCSLARQDVAGLLFTPSSERNIACRH